MHNYTIGGDLVVCMTATDVAVVMDGELYYTHERVPNKDSSITCSLFNHDGLRWGITLQIDGSFHLVDEVDQSYAKTDPVPALKHIWNMMYICQRVDFENTTTLHIVASRLWAKLCIQW